MAEEDRPGYAFRSGPPAAVSKFLAEKGEALTFSFRDMEPEEHAVAFTVAKAAHVDVLRAIRGEVQRALDEGRTLQDFQAQLEPKLRELGWWGKQKMKDPLTGRERIVQLGSPRRLRTIYRANVRSARAAGQWERIERTRDVLPYLLYQLGPSERHRPSHEVQAGQVRHSADPWWRWWMPPNGWGCKCTVRQVSEAEAQRRGVEPTVKPALVDMRNPRTGEIRRVPPGLDPAWAGNPGLTRRANAEALLNEKLDAAPPEIARVAAADVSRSWRVRRMFDGPGDARAPIGRMPRLVHEVIGTESPLIGLHQNVVTHVRKHGLATPENFAAVQRMVDEGEVRRYPDGRLLLMLFDAEMPLVLVLKKQAGDREAFIATLFRCNRVNYVHNKVAETKAVRSDPALDAWMARNPRGTKRRA